MPSTVVADGMSSLNTLLSILGLLFSLKTWLFASFLFFVLVLFDVVTTPPSLPSTLPRVGHPPGLIGTVRNYFSLCFNYKYWLQQGYDQFSKHDQSFVVPSGAARPAHIIVPRSQTSWFLGLPDHVMGATEAQNTLLHSHYSFPVNPQQGYVFPLRVIHNYLNRALNSLTPAIWEEVQDAMDVAIGCDTDNWKTVNVWNISLEMLTRITNRVLVGPGMNRNSDLLKHMIDFVDDVIMNCFVLDFLPKSLHPLIGPIVSIPNKIHYKRGAKYTVPLIKQRLDDMARKEAGDPAYAKWHEPQDFITWTIRMAKMENNAAELEPESIAKRLLPIEFAAIHTTTVTCMYAIIDIMSTDPSLGVVDDLRREAARVLEQEGGKWTKEGLSRLDQLDSAIRESQRFSTFALTLTERMVVAPEGVTNDVEGWHAPKGTVVKLNLYSVHKDPSVYQNPEVYDPFRYSRARDDLLAATNGTAGVVQLKKTGLTTTSDTHLAFSHGRHACPGRFFVGQELKMVLANLLLNYDIKPISERPATQWLGSVALPPMKATIELRRRKTQYTSKDFAK